VSLRRGRQIRKDKNMKKLILAIATIAIVAMLVISARAASDYITFEWRQDSVLMRWSGPANAANYYGSLCIQKIKPVRGSTLCVWDLHGRYTTQNNVWFVIAYAFTPGTYKITSGTVAAYDSLGNIMASQSFTSSATWMYPYKVFHPAIRKSNPYP
jgi:hypothetical protein